MSEPLVLGAFVFEGFEVPERVTAGGSQRLVVHALPGGGRVVDAMGADEADISWAGIFSGAEAPDRARALDALRMAGGALPLVWGAAFYTVAIARFEAEFRSPWWVPYRIRCTVLRNEGAAPAGAMADLLAEPGPEADRATAAGYAGVADVGGADAQIAAAGVRLGSDEPAVAIEAAGVLARVSAARGYLGRAAAGS